MKEVLRTVLDAKIEVEKAKPTLKVGVVLFTNDNDDPLGTHFLYVAALITM